MTVPTNSRAACFLRFFCGIDGIGGGGRITMAGSNLQFCLVEMAILIGSPG